MITLNPIIGGLMLFNIVMCARSVYESYDKHPHIVGLLGWSTALMYFCVYSFSGPS